MQIKKQLVKQLLQCVRIRLHQPSESYETAPNRRAIIMNEVSINRSVTQIYIHTVQPHSLSKREIKKMSTRPRVT